MIERKGIIRKPYQEHLVPGKKYHVTKTFFDSVKSVHRVGETWTYWGYLPSGFGEATAIFATDDGGKECSFGIDWNSLDSNLGLENIKEYINEALPLALPGVKRGCAKARSYYFYPSVCFGSIAAVAKLTANFLNLKS